jgi:hypothetical protein
LVSRVLRKSKFVTLRCSKLILKLLVSGAGIVCTRSTSCAII